MKSADKDTYGYRLVQILKKLNQGQKLAPKALADEFGVNLRAIQRDLNERFAFLNLEKVDGRYQMPSILLGKLNVQDVERFASLAGVRGLFPSLSDDFLRELFDSRTQSAILIKGPHYEDLGGKEILFDQLEEAIHGCKHITYTYQKIDGIKTYRQVEPHKLVNHDGIWYLAAKDDGKLKAFTLVKIHRLQVAESTFLPDLILNKTLAEEDGIWLNEKKLEVVLKITGTAASYFRRRKWVANQVILKELEDGGMIVSAKVAHINQILPIVRQWLPCIRIMSPEGLQADMEKEIRSYLSS
ncbi:MAG: DNA-binding protein [Burkholderiales bacterium RIFOXYD2_FULL_59_8]|nr:MAG: DNA-binding protein [Burkholderiales bacterium RIFOXYD2_FULL_59_8]